MSRVARWYELTPQAQAACWVQVDEVLAQVPNQEVVPVVRESLEADPRLIPAFLEAATTKLAEGE
jgi:hypothetical protein